VLAAYGLRTYIWNNRLRALLLLAGFPLLLLLISFAFALVIAALSDPTVGEGFAAAFRLLPSLFPVALAGALLWFLIAWFANQRIIDAVTHARKVDRASEPRLWNLLENLCISRGIAMPQLRIIESDARNAMASGIRKSQYSITVTRGLMNALSDAELEAVMAHELTHIENRDTQLLVVAAVFVGIISLVGDILIRGPRMLLWSSSSGSGGGGGGGGGTWRSSSRGSSRSGGKGGGGLIILILVAVVIFLLARLLAIALRLAISRNREYLADAGSVELTKDADAMIGALRKVEGHSEISAPSQVQEMFFDHPTGSGLGGLFATHPAIEARIANLVKFAGGHDAGPSVAPPVAANESTTPAAIDPQLDRTEAPHPWGMPAPGPWDTPRG
jgi:heat shock protein HtpX